eukprot:1383727-Rhodomonas_salina.1
MRCPVLTSRVMGPVHAHYPAILDSASIPKEVSLGQLPTFEAGTQHVTFSFWLKAGACLREPYAVPGTDVGTSLGMAYAASARSQAESGTDVLYEVPVAPYKQFSTVFEFNGYEGLSPEEITAKDADPEWEG